MSVVPYNERRYFLPKAFKFLLPGQVPLLDFPLPPETQVRLYTERFEGPWKYNSALSNRNETVSKDTMPASVASKAFLDVDPLKHLSRYRKAKPCLTENSQACRYNSWVGMWEFSEELLERAKFRAIDWTWKWAKV